MTIDHHDPQTIAGAVAVADREAQRITGILSREGWFGLGEVDRARLGLCGGIVKDLAAIVEGHPNEEEASRAYDAAAVEAQIAAVADLRPAVYACLMGARGVVASEALASAADRARDWRTYGEGLGGSEDRPATSESRAVVRRASRQLHYLRIVFRAIWRHHAHSRGMRGQHAGTVERVGESEVTIEHLTEGWIVTHETAGERYACRIASDVVGAAEDMFGFW